MLAFPTQGQCHRKLPNKVMEVTVYQKHYFWGLICTTLFYISLISVCLQSRRPGFDPWVQKIPWRREWQHTPVFLPREFYGQRSLVGYSAWDHKESYTTE